MRQLPVYLLLDTSGSMRGEPIEAVNVGLEAMVGALRQDPHALETVHLSVITFDREAKVAVPLTALDELRLPRINTPDSGPTHLGEALRLLCRQVDREVIRGSAGSRGDWQPLLFVMTDGSPSDGALFEEQAVEVGRRRFALVVGCAAGPKAKREHLEKFCDHVVNLDTTDSSTFTPFFKWLTVTVGNGNRSLGATTGVALPPAPIQDQVVL